MDNENKIKLVKLDDRARNGGIGYMVRLKRAWDECYSEFRHLTMQCLHDNAGRFRKDKTITNLILVRNRDEVTEQLKEVPNKSNNGKIKKNDNRPVREIYWMEMRKNLKRK